MPISFPSSLRWVDENGSRLYETGVGGDDPYAEEVIDKVGFDYLDLTGDDYLGHITVSRPR